MTLSPEAAKRLKLVYLGSPGKWEVPEVDFPVKRLGRREFASALQKGLGRAFLHASRFGLDGVADLVLEACLRNQGYDPQVESSKSPWLFAMFGTSPEYSEFKKKILGALKVEKESWKLLQLFELAREMAEHGDHGARKAIVRRAQKIAGVQCKTVLLVKVPGDRHRIYPVKDREIHYPS